MVVGIHTFVHYDVWKLFAVLCSPLMLMVLGAWSIFISVPVGFHIRLVLLNHITLYDEFGLQTTKQQCSPIRQSSHFVPKILRPH